MEEYKIHADIDGFAFYENGEVYKGNKKINGYLNENGFLTFGTKNNKKKQIHRIIAELFVDNPNNYKCIQHIDNDKINNHYKNLKWIGQIHNIRHTLHYNNELLNKCIVENLFNIQGSFPDKITSETQLSILCKTCNQLSYKRFKSLYESGQLCKSCAKLEGFKKKNKTCLERFGVEHVSQSKEIKEKVKKTCLEKYGVEYALQSKEVKDKGKQTCLEKYGVEYSLQSQEVKDKGKKTCIEKYGVEYSLQSQEIRDKVKHTCLEKYGVEYVTQTEDFKEKSKQTCLKNWGVEHSFQSAEIREKSKQTCIERLGVEYPSQCQEVQEKNKQTSLKNWGTQHPSQCEINKEHHKQTNLKVWGVEYPSQNAEVKQRVIQTSLKNWGVEHPTQNKDVMERCSKNAYKLKKYIFPSGKIIKIQGYENYALDELITIYNEDDIINGSSNVPDIWYCDEYGNKHRHYVDLFIKSKQLCIEVKSTWTAEKKKDNIFLKQKSGKILGYNYEIWVYDNKGIKVIMYK